MEAAEGAHGDARQARASATRSSPTAASPARCREVGDHFVGVEIADNVRVTRAEVRHRQRAAQGHAEVRLIRPPTRSAIRKGGSRGMPRCSEFARWKYFLILAVVLLWRGSRAAQRLPEGSLRPGHRQPHRQAGCGAGGVRARRTGQDGLHPKAVAIEGSNLMARMTNLGEAEQGQHPAAQLAGRGLHRRVEPGLHRARNGCRVLGGKPMVLEPGPAGRRAFRATGGPEGGAAEEASVTFAGDVRATLPHFDRIPTRAMQVQPDAPSSATLRASPPPATRWNKARNAIAQSQPAWWSTPATAHRGHDPRRQARQSAPPTRAGRTSPPCATA